MGQAEIRACFDGWADSPGRGAYYYSRYLEPIALHETDAARTWEERAPGPEAASDAGVQWVFSQLSQAVMRGTWRQGRRSLPFRLAPVAWDQRQTDSPCASYAFLGPRLEGGTVTSEPASSEASPSPFVFTRHVYHPPPHLADDVAITTFTIAETQPGDRRINAALRAHLPDQAGGYELADCLGGSIGSLGIDGYLDRTLEPLMLTEAFLSAEETVGNFCGGAHPNYWTAFRAFDRDTGETLDLFDWIGPPRIAYSRIPESLRPAILSGLTPSDEPAECHDLLEVADYWSLGLRYEGLLFRPDLPHVVTACEESVLIEWDTLAPYLDEEGQAGLLRLKNK